MGDAFKLFLGDVGSKEMELLLLADDVPRPQVPRQTNNFPNWPCSLVDCVLNPGLCGVLTRPKEVWCSALRSTASRRIEASCTYSLASKTAHI